MKKGTKKNWDSMSHSTSSLVKFNVIKSRHNKIIWLITFKTKKTMSLGPFYIVDKQPK